MRENTKSKYSGARESKRSTEPFMCTTGKFIVVALLLKFIFSRAHSQILEGPKLPHPLALPLRFSCTVSCSSSSTQLPEWCVTGGSSHCGASSGRGALEVCSDANITGLQECYPDWNVSSSVPWDVTSPCSSQPNVTIFLDINALPTSDQLVLVCRTALCNVSNSYCYSKPVIIGLGEGGTQTQTESNVNLTPHPTLSSSSPLPSVPYQPLPALTTAYSSSSSSATESVSPMLHPSPELDDHSTAPGTASSSRNYRPTLPIISSTVTECGCCVPAGIDDSVASVASSAVVGFLGLVFGLASLLVAVAYARRVKKAKKDTLMEFYKAPDPWRSPRVSMLLKPITEVEMDTVHSSRANTNQLEVPSSSAAAAAAMRNVGYSETKI